MTPSRREPDVSAFDDPPAEPEGDVTPDLMADDILFDRWTPGDARRASEAPVNDARPPARQVWYDDIAICHRPAPTFLIDELVPDEALGVLWGPPECGKTFLALGWALAIATGRDCLGRPVVRPGPAIYVVGEGAAHFGRRVTAWKLANAWPIDTPAGLNIHDGAIDLGHDAAVDRFIRDARPREPRLVAIDTWARCLPGADENAARDAGIAVASLDRIKADLGCTVVVLHHATKSGDAERGSSALRGAADFMLGLALVDDLRVLTPDKSKDFGRPDVINLELAEVPGAGSMVMRLAGGVGASVTTFELAALRALRDSFPDGAKHTELQVAANLRERTAYRTVARLIELRMAAKSGTILRLTDYGRIVADRGLE